MREQTGHDGIPVLVAEDGTVLADAEPIIAFLDSHYEEPSQARRHRAQARAHELTRSARRTSPIARC